LLTTSKTAACLLVLTASSVVAQEMPSGMGDASPRPSSRIERIEVGARQGGTELRRAAMVAKQIYGREELDKYADSNVLDVLKRLPGVNIAGGGPRLRGLGSGYTLILINGDPAPPGFALDQLSPAQIERIEVTKGPTADQSAQAIAGAINIILKDAPRVSQRDLRLSANYAVDKPTANANFTYGEKIGAIALSLPLSYFEWRNENRFNNQRFMPGKDQLPAQSIQEGAQQFWGHGVNLGPRANWKISDEQTLSLQTFLQKGYWNNQTDYSANRILSGLPSLDDNGEQHGTWQNLNGNLHWVNRFANDQRIELKAGVQQSKGTSKSQTTRAGLPQLQTAGENEVNTLSQSGKYTRLLGDEHSLTAGWDLEWRRREETRRVSELGVAQLPEFDGQPFAARIERQAFFVQDEWELSPQWSTYVGLRGEQITTESTGTASPVRNTSRVVTPLWHLNYKLDAKGRDVIRASVTRSYKAPEVNSLLARPAVNALFTDLRQSNTELSPDRIGNPLLAPELATGLDIAYEKYLTGGGMFSIGVFHRRISQLMRNVTSLQVVDWASAPRWVTLPTNFSSAQTTGIELEVKGRAGELAPDWFDPKLALNLRGSVSFFRSQVDALPGPNDRLDGQQPWSGNLGFDYRFADWPLTTGASLNFTPGYETRQTVSQSLEQSRTRDIDLFAQWAFSRAVSLRLSANNFSPFDTYSRTGLSSGYGSTAMRRSLPRYGATLEIKL
jgi:iron complex outermembrane receptor protein